MESYYWFYSCDNYFNMVMTFYLATPCWDTVHKLATTALKVLAVAKRPLSLLELGWAVALGVSQNRTRLPRSSDSLGWCSSESYQADPGLCCSH